jgi:hypothetical protein
MDKQIMVEMLLISRRKELTTNTRTQAQTKNMTSDLPMRKSRKDI